MPDNTKAITRRPTSPRQFFPQLFYSLFIILYKDDNIFYKGSRHSDERHSYRKYTSYLSVILRSS
jgi:hypothetical protein